MYSIFPIPVWDPTVPYAEVFLKLLKEPPCDNPVWSPVTDEDLMNQTFDVLDKWNIYGVLSGTTDRVSKWRSLKPERLYPAIEMAVGPEAPSVDYLRSLYSNGELIVLGELTTQYRGVYPDDERLTPYFILAEVLDIPVGIHV